MRSAQTSQSSVREKRPHDRHMKPSNPIPLRARTTAAYHDSRLTSGCTVYKGMRWVFNLGAMARFQLHALQCHTSLFPASTSHFICFASTALLHQ